MMKEGDYDWERQGDRVVDLIGQYAEVEPQPAEDIQNVLSSRNFDKELAEMGEEQPFDDDAHYDKSGVDDAESQAGWLRFEQVLKTEGRFFSSVAEATLTSIFNGIAEHQTESGRPIIVDAGPATQLAAIYRARAFQSNQKLEDALKRPDKEIGPPPPSAAIDGRMNARGIAVFYGATDPLVALKEVRPPVGSRVVVGRFELLRPLRLLDIEAIRSVNVRGSVFDRDYIRRLERAKFLEWLSRRITMPVMPDDEPFEYLATQAIADFLAADVNSALDGILYPSAQGNEGKPNVVLFHKAARVQSLDIPSGTEISASLYGHTEDGLEINYRVSEEVPPQTPPITVQDDDFTFFPEPINALDPEDHDGRSPTLKLDTATLAVHHVRGVEFQTETHPVSRHRSQKRERNF